MSATRVLRVLAAAGASRAPPTGPARGEAPQESFVELSMVDFIYDTDAPWPIGTRFIKTVNHGREDHQVRIDRLRVGVTLQDRLTAEERSSIAEPVSGVARTGPGQTVYVPFEFVPGTCVLNCLVPAAATGQPHAGIGMIRAVTVE